MQKQLTIRLDEKIYYRLCQLIGKAKISRFIEELLKPHVIKDDIEDTEKSREIEAIQWSEAIF